jgi:hypothetical protein
VGQKAAFFGALVDILAKNARLGTYSDISTLEQAIEALDEIVRALDDCPTPVALPIRRLECSVCHLDKVTVYDPECESAYLIHDGRLLKIDVVRIAREYNHWRVKLVGSNVQLPVQWLARVLVSDDSNLTGLTLEEVRQWPITQH